MIGENDNAVCADNIGDDNDDSTLLKLLASLIFDEYNDELDVAASASVADENVELLDRDNVQGRNSMM